MGRQSRTSRDQGCPVASPIATRYGSRSRGGSRGSGQGNCGRGRAKGEQSSEKCRRSDRYVASGHPIEIFANTELDCSREKLDNCVSIAYRDFLLFSRPNHGTSVITNFHAPSFSQQPNSRACPNQPSSKSIATKLVGARWLKRCCSKE